MQDRSKQFDAAMFEIYRRAKSEAGYTAAAFLKMLNDRVKAGDDGGVLTAKFLINSPKVSQGYTALSERGRLDLTVEAMVVENTKWHSLFTAEDLAKARSRLKEYGYTPKSSEGV